MWGPPGDTRMAGRPRLPTGVVLGGHCGVLGLAGRDRACATALHEVVVLISVVRTLVALKTIPYLASDPARLARTGLADPRQWRDAWVVVLAAIRARH